jgi:hypothetical protein
VPYLYMSTGMALPSYGWNRQWIQAYALSNQLDW